MKFPFEQILFLQSLPKSRHFIDAIMDSTPVRHSTRPSAPQSSPPLPHLPSTITTLSSPAAPSRINLTSELSQLDDPTPVVSDAERQPDQNEADEAIDDDDSSAAADGQEDTEEEPDPENDIVEETLRFWRSRRSSFPVFIKQWATRRRAGGRRYSGSHTYQLLAILRDPEVRARLHTAGLDLHFSGEEQAKVEPDKLRQEYSILMRQSAFSQFNPADFDIDGDKGLGRGSDGKPSAETVKDVCGTQWIDSALRHSWSQMEECSPKLLQLLTTLTVRERGNRPSYSGLKAGDTSHTRARIYMIATSLLNTFAPSRSNFLQKVLGIYLHSSGVPRRVIDTLARFGVCSAYRPTLKLLDKLASQSEVGSPE